MYDPREVLEICEKAKLPWGREGSSDREHTFTTPDRDYACSVTIKQIGPAILHEWMEEQRLINSDFVLMASSALPELAQRVIEIEKRLQQAEADNAGIDTKYRNAIGVIEKAILDGKIDYMGFQKQIDAFIQYAANPRPGAALLEELETYKKALELASELHCVAGSCPNDDDCNDTGDCEKCWCNYFLTQAKEAADAE